MKEPSSHVFSGEQPRTSLDIDHIIRLLKLRRMGVYGPTERNGESIYQINDHTLIRHLAEHDSLTIWGIYNYVKNRGRNRRE
jgi:hypothetical protein